MSNVNDLNIMISMMGNLMLLRNLRNYSFFWWLCLDVMWFVMDFRPHEIMTSWVTTSCHSSWRSCWKLSSFGVIMHHSLHMLFISHPCSFIICFAINCRICLHLFFITWRSSIHLRTMILNTKQYIES